MTDLRRMFVVFLAIVAFMSGALFAQIEDSEGATASEFALSTQSIDVRSGSKSLTFTVSAADNLSGVEYVCLYLRDPGGSNYGWCGSERISGTNLSGVFRGSIWIDQYARSGTWNVYQILTRDRVGNHRWYSSWQSGFPTGNGALEVIAAVRPPDTAPPTLISHSFSEQVDASGTTGGRSAFDVVLRSDVTTEEPNGDFNYGFLQFYDPASGTWRGVGFNESSRVADDSLPDGQARYRGSIHFPRYDSGAYKLAYIGLGDRRSNWQYYYTPFYCSGCPNQITAGPTTITVQSVPADVAQPTLVEFDFSPKEIDVAGADGRVTVRGRMNDDLSGSSWVWLQFYSTRLNQYRWMSVTKFDRSGTGATFEGYVDFPRYSAAGIWRLQYVAVQDNIGRYRYYYTNDLDTLGFPTILQISSGLKVFDASASWGTSAELSARLMSAGSPIAGETISFSIDGQAVGTAVTDSDGYARKNVSVAGLGSGIHEIVGSFGGRPGVLAAGSGTAKLTIIGQDQTITFPAISDKYVGSVFNLSATASSGLPVSYTLISGPATLSGSQVKVTGVGTVSIRASQAGGGQWSPAPPVDRSFQSTANLPPVLSLPANMTIEATGASGAAVTFTATATDDIDPSPTVTCSPASGSVFALGGTNVSCTATDSAGNTSSGSFSVTVRDTTPPLLSYPANVTAEATGPSGATVTFETSASDSVSGTVAVVCSPASGSLFALGNTTVSCSATDGAGNTASASVRVIVSDRTRPVITVNGGNVVLECSAAYTDAGATASDIVSGNLSVSTTGSVDANTPSTYTITYSATDGAGNTATATRTVTVRDTTPPLLTLNGVDEVVVECHASYSDAGATATDSCNGNLTSSINVASNVNANAPGRYTVTYAVADASGNRAQITRNVIVRDTTAPALSLNGASDVIHECHVPYVDGGATASDACAGDLTSAVKVTGSVDYNTPGVYTLTYSVSDPSGNGAQSVTRTVRVVDTKKPVITLIGGNVTHECHDAYTDPGATADDACAGRLPVSVSGSVDVNRPGTYTLTYSAVDAAGNVAAEVTRTVTVRDTTPPAPVVSTLPTISGQCAVTVTDAPTASDACGGLIIGRTTDPLSYSVQGRYTVTWTYSDDAGNSSTQQQTVIVKDTIAPSVQTPASQSVVTAECSVAVPQFAVDATDNCTSTSDLRVVQSPAAGTFIGLGNHVVKITVTDAVGNSTEVSTSFAVSNAAPMVSAEGPYSVDEGSSVALLPAGSDAGGPVSFAWDLNNDGIFETAAPASFDASQLDDSVNAIAVEGRDKCGIPATSATTVVVKNVAPSVSITSPTAESGLLFKKGDTVTVTSSFTDAGTKDTHSCTVNWDNGLGAVAGALDQSARTCTSSLQLNAAGVYSVKVAVTDDDGGVGSATVMVVVYDPAAGFVTGGGWIISPAGAYAADATLQGKAHFAFVSKYQKGNTVPTGETNFRFEAGSFRFDSIRYEWMVISGRKAQYRGVGTVNGSGDYGFLLTAYDENMPGGDGQDKFRIKIWDRSQGNRVVYDNRMSQSDDIDAANPQNIGAGSIVIHSGK